MVTSKSNIDRSFQRWLALAVIVLWVGVANAGGRKRVVVLDFEGPKAEKFHDDVVKLIKKSHSVISAEKWNGAAEELGAAGSMSGRNIKKVAKKLKIDGVVTGRIEKRRDEYLIHLKLLNGTTGEAVGGGVDTKAGGPRIDGKAQRELKDELIGAIDELEANHGGGGGDDDDAGDAPKTKKKHGGDDDDTAETTKTKKKKHAADDDDSAAAADDSKHGGFSKRSEKGSDKVASDDDTADAPKSKKKKDKEKDKEKKAADDDAAAALATKHDDDPPKNKHSDDDTTSEDTPKKAKKKVASDDDSSGGETSTEAEAEGPPPGDEALGPTQRAIDATLGMSFVARQLGFTFSNALAGSQVPSKYHNSPVAGANFDATIFPLAMSHTNKSAMAGLGFEIAYDRVLRISAQKQYFAQGSSMPQTANLQVASERYQLGAVYRVPVGKMAVGGRLLYSGQNFLVQQGLPNGMTGAVNGSDIPSVHYQMLSIGGFIRYPIMPKLALDADVAFLAVFGTGSGTGDIGSAGYYGKATTSGEELNAGAEYQLMKNVFLRAAFHLETIGLSFKSDPNTFANLRDGDGANQDVFSARDTYYGVIFVAGYAY